MLFFYEFILVVSLPPTINCVIITRMDIKKQLQEKEIDLLGDDHTGSSSDTPLRSDAFDLSDIEKIAAIQKRCNQYFKYARHGPY